MPVNFIIFWQKIIGCTSILGPPLPSKIHKHQRGLCKIEYVKNHFEVGHSFYKSSIWSPSNVNFTYVSESKNWVPNSGM
jgi:hypothetical protein